MEYIDEDQIDAHFEQKGNELIEGYTNAQDNYSDTINMVKLASEITSNEEKKGKKQKGNKKEATEVSNKTKREQALRKKLSLPEEDMTFLKKETREMIGIEKEIGDYEKNFYEDAVTAATRYEKALENAIGGRGVGYNDGLFDEEIDEDQEKKEQALQKEEKTESGEVVTEILEYAKSDKDLGESDKEIIEEIVQRYIPGLPKVFNILNECNDFIGVSSKKEDFEDFVIYSLLDKEDGELTEDIEVPNELKPFFAKARSLVLETSSTLGALCTLAIKILIESYIKYKKNEITKSEYFFISNDKSSPILLKINTIYNYLTQNVLDKTCEIGSRIIDLHFLKIQQDRIVNNDTNIEAANKNDENFEENTEDEDNYEYDENENENEKTGKEIDTDITEDDLENRRRKLAKESDELLSLHQNENFVADVAYSNAELGAVESAAYSSLKAKQEKFKNASADVIASSFEERQMQKSAEKAERIRRIKEKENEEAEALVNEKDNLENENDEEVNEQKKQVEEYINRLNDARQKIVQKKIKAHQYKTEIYDVEEKEKVNGSRRNVTKQIDKNIAALRRHKKEATGNGRVQMRKKYEKAIKKLKSVNRSRREIEMEGYQGEKLGIRTKVVRSKKIF